MLKHFIIILVLFSGCNSENEKNSTNEKAKLFDKFQELIKDVEPPIIINCSHQSSNKDISFEKYYKGMFL